MPLFAITDRFFSLKLHQTKRLKRIKITNMKKVFSIVAVVSMLFATSCGNKCKCPNCKCSEGTQCEAPCGKPEFPGKPGEGPDGPRGPKGECRGEFKGPRHQMNPEMAEKIGKWMNFDSLTVDEQKALIAERKAAIDSMDAARKAKKAEMEEKWANFDKLSIEEQKQLLDQKNRMPFHKKGMRPGCPGGRPDHQPGEHHGEHHGGPRGDK